MWFLSILAGVIPSFCVCGRGFYIQATSALSAKDSLQADMKQLEAAVSQDAMGGQTASMADLQQKVAGLELELQNVSPVSTPQLQVSYIRSCMCV